MENIKQLDLSNMLKYIHTTLTPQLISNVCYRMFERIFIVDCYEEEFDPDTRHWQY